MERRVEKYYFGEWVYVPFSDLETGDKFRMFDGEEPVVGDEGNTEFAAMCNAFINQHGEYQINIK